MFWKRKNKTNDKPQDYVMTADQIKPLVPRELGGCIATNKITKEGFPVRFMYRTAQHNSYDSGWHFMSGLEDDDYMRETSNHDVYDVNTIANYDPSIIPHLDTSANCAFEKASDEHEFIQVFDFDFPY